ncbi:MAG: hypothetical protein QOF21_989 [Actinomycetota bacterium]
MVINAGLSKALLHRGSVREIDDLDVPASERIGDRDRFLRHGRTRISRNELVRRRSLKTRTVEGEDCRCEAFDLGPVALGDKQHCPHVGLPLEPTRAKSATPVLSVEPDAQSPHPREQVNVDFVEVAGEKHTVFDQPIVRVIVAKGPVVGQPKRSRPEPVAVTWLADLVEQLVHSDTIRSSRWRTALGDAQQLKDEARARTSPSRHMVDDPDVFEAALL